MGTPSRERQLIDGVWQYVTAEEGGGGGSQTIAQILDASNDAAGESLNNLLYVGADTVFADTWDIQNSNHLTLDAPLDANNKAVTGLPAPGSGSAAATKDYVDTADALLQTTSEKGQSDGYASLDAGGTIPLEQIPFFPATVSTAILNFVTAAAQTSGVTKTLDLTVVTAPSWLTLENDGQTVTIEETGIYEIGWSFNVGPASSALNGLTAHIAHSVAAAKEALWNIDTSGGVGDMFGQVVDTVEIGAGQSFQLTITAQISDPGGDTWSAFGGARALAIKKLGS